MVNEYIRVYTFNFSRHVSHYSCVDWYVLLCVGSDGSYTKDNRRYECTCGHHFKQNPILRVSADVLASSKFHMQKSDLFIGPNCRPMRDNWYIYIYKADDD